MSADMRRHVAPGERRAVWASAGAHVIDSDANAPKGLAMFERVVRAGLLAVGLSGCATAGSTGAPATKLSVGFNAREDNSWQQHG